MLIYTLTWVFQAIGLGLFWGQPGPALLGFLSMGILVIWAWRKELSTLPTFQSSNPSTEKSRLWTSSSGP
jgi:hypothetical protein